jgi:hypothetical protein
MDATLEDFLGALPSNPALIEPDEGLVLTHQQFRRLVWTCRGHEAIDLMARRHEAR